jgi:hypothetical protein
MAINIQRFNEVVAAAKSRTRDKRWLRAIDRAAEGILSGELIVTTLRVGALVTSPNESYMANGVCGCKAFNNGHKECRHRAAARLMDLYETAPEAVSLAADVAASPRANLIAEITNIWPRFAPRLPLAVELMARFRVNRLEMLDDDCLRRVRLAISM